MALYGLKPLAECFNSVTFEVRTSLQKHGFLPVNSKKLHIFLFRFILILRKSKYLPRSILKGLERYIRSFEKFPNKLNSEKVLNTFGPIAAYNFESEAIRQPPSSLHTANHCLQSHCPRTVDIC